MVRGRGGVGLGDLLFEGRPADGCWMQRPRQKTDGHRKALRAKHPSTLTSMGNLASTFLNPERGKEAEGLDVHVIEARGCLGRASRHNN